MRLLNALKAEWKSRSTAEKIKLIMHGILMIGGSTVGNAIGDKCSEGRSRIERGCVRVTGWILGGVIADTSAKALDQYVDECDEMIKARKEKKAKEEEADA